MADAGHMCDKALVTAIMLRAGVSEVLCSTLSFMKVGTKVMSPLFLCYVWCLVEFITLPTK